MFACWEEQLDLLPEHEKAQCTVTSCSSLYASRFHASAGMSLESATAEQMFYLNVGLMYFSILKATHLHRRAGSCSTVLCRSWHGRRFFHCQPAGIRLCTKRPTRSQSTHLCHLLRRTNPGVVAGQGCRTDLMGGETKLLRSTKLWDTVC